MAAVRSCSDLPSLLHHHGRTSSRPAATSASTPSAHGQAFGCGGRGHGDGAAGSGVGSGVSALVEAVSDDDDFDRSATNSARSVPIVSAWATSCWRESDSSAITGSRTDVIHEANAGGAGG